MSDNMNTPVLPGVEWPEPVLTADLIIKNYLEDSLKQEQYFSLSINAGMKFEPKDPSLEAQVAKWRRNAYLYSLVGTQGIAALLILIQDLAPGLADKLLREWWEKVEAGDVLHEWVWEWATKRGMDPEEIMKTASDWWKETHGE